MPDHLRKQIRDRIATNLTGLANTGLNVFPTRFYPLETDQLPALLVFTTEEENDLDGQSTSSAGIGNTRFLTLVIGVHVRESDGDLIDDSLDAISYDVEVAMANDRGINNLALDSYYVGMESELFNDGDQPIAVMTMTYTIEYSVTTSTPDTVR